MTNPQITRDTTSDRVASHLRAQILEGTLPAGDKLPPERMLAAELGVNRVTLRSALAQLAAEKLVAIRQGSGATVADFLDSGGPALIPAWIALAKGSAARAAIADLLAVRRALTRIVLEKVVDQIDARGHARLQRHLAHYTEVAARGDIDALAHADVEMARAVVKEAKSPVLALVINPVGHVLASLPELRGAIFRKPQQNVLGWTALVHALAHPSRRVIDEILDVMRAHDDDTLQHLSPGRKR